MPSEYVDRICEYIVGNISKVSRIAVFYKQNLTCQISHSMFWADKLNRHPNPKTVISIEDFENGKWKVSSNMSKTLPSKDENALNDYARSYLSSVKQIKIKSYGPMMASINSAIDPKIDEALFFYSIVRRSQVIYRAYDNNPLLSFNSIFSPECQGLFGVESADNSRSMNLLKGFREVIFAGDRKVITASMEGKLKSMNVKVFD